MNVTDINSNNKRQRKRNSNPYKNNANNAAVNKRKDNSYAHKIDVFSKRNYINNVVYKLNNNKGKIITYGCLFFFGIMLLFTVMAGLLLKLLFFIVGF